ncbi:hypothetical protein PABG_06958 [Paracoccidioides brasiliensis Pb03]|uniref:NADH:flavin oxidoreductase/NADH oxidase N-terminal domain-containing protein n=2 Tax=Paracoccidioides brasiliensis TaxID=121759 RepID=C1GGX7_PARBD|nr:uncharacterized protein PADG_06196 [Paracoccidioides brasiliensis Pb18]EEH16871.1 hypothetical protein PABG_06958 [Paracoccidioides brasiliensis Pb03]EEH50117.2 hypothetical protein PADG_06196 [Paracoccidioides brasiliensis Pb18]ODH36475.1 hypothetical protein ACO22_02757 [Paracoccidioides brasiliensis]ODH48141.1 hypothetical protein GX48_05736 [Paracoccidioides brasiliensis]
MASFAPLKDTALFKPLQLGALQLEHRIVLAPLTRMRSTKESEGVYVPNDLNVTYYSQRATKGGFLLTEATPISRHAAGYPGVPGIFTSSQIAGWKRVTDAVHAKGGFIYCQLWHVGRATVPSLLDGKPAVSASTIPISGNALDGSRYADFPPKALTVEEIKELVEEYAAAAKRALEAGFDGVEIHGANGYLLDQFLHDNVNVRTDAYGGSIANRARFPLEVIRAVTAAIGADRVGIRLSPYNYFQDTRDSNPNQHWVYLCEQIAALPAASRPAYVHMIEPRFDEVLDEEAKLAALAATAEGGAGKKKDYSLDHFRRPLKKGGVALLAAGNFKRENCIAKLKGDGADAVVFGRLFLANPDFVKRLRDGLELNKYDRSTFYGASPPEKGYTDYPSL